MVPIRAIVVEAPLSTARLATSRRVALRGLNRIACLLLLIVNGRFADDGLVFTSC